MADGGTSQLGSQDAVKASPVSSDSSEDETEEHLDSGLHELWKVDVDATAIMERPVESDIFYDIAEKFCRQMREQPCTPGQANGRAWSGDEICLCKRMYLYSCPFVNADNQARNFQTNNRFRFLHHVCAGVSDASHKELYECVATASQETVNRFAGFSEAIATGERIKWLQLGLAVRRRSLHLLCTRYNDDSIQSLCFFIGCQQRTTCSGYKSVDLSAPLDECSEDSMMGKPEIRYVTREWFYDLEIKYPGTLVGNFSYLPWKDRYAQFGSQNAHGIGNMSFTPLEPPLSTCAGLGQHISTWAIQLNKYQKSFACILFGFTEDVICEDDSAHMNDTETHPFARRLCATCKTPICFHCSAEIAKTNFKGNKCGESSMPMALSNDHIYGHVHEFFGNGAG